MDKTEIKKLEEVITKLRELIEDLSNEYDLGDYIQPENYYNYTSIYPISKMDNNLITIIMN